VAERCGFYCGWGWYSENSCIVLEGWGGGSLQLFCSTADDAIYTLVSFLQPAIPLKCELVMSSKDFVLSHVLVVLISCVCVCGVGGRAKVTSTGLVV